MPRQSNKGRKFPPEPLSGCEVKSMLAQCGKRYPSPCRNRALIATIYRTGLRVSEALALYPKDVSFENGTVRVLHGKGDKSRTVGIDDTALGYISDWMEHRKRLGLNGPLFCTLEGKPLASVYVRNVMKRLAKKAGIEKRVHPHGLRHTMADEMRRENVDIGIIQKQLGHSTPSTTSIYLDHVSPKQVVEAVRNREW